MDDLLPPTGKQRRRPYWIMAVGFGTIAAIMVFSNLASPSDVEEITDALMDDPTWTGTEVEARCMVQRGVDTLGAKTFVSMLNSDFTEAVTESQLTEFVRIVVACKDLTIEMAPAFTAESGLSEAEAQCVVRGLSKRHLEIALSRGIEITADRSLVTETEVRDAEAAIESATLLCLGSDDA